MASPEFKKRRKYTYIAAILSFLCSCKNTPIVSERSRVIEAPATEQISIVKTYDIASVIKEIVDTPEKDIDIGKYCLMLDNCFNPKVNVEEYLKKLDSIAETVQRRLAGVKEPEKSIEILNQYLFEELEITPIIYRSSEEKDMLFLMGNRLLLSLEETLEEKSSLLSNVIDKRKGNCMGLSVLYLSIAHRLKLPFFGVSLPGYPGHFFPRYDDGKIQINVETGYKGMNISNIRYLKDYSYVKEPHIRDSLLTNKNRKEVLGSYLRSTIPTALRRDTENKQSIKLMMEYLEYASNLSPNDFEILNDKGRCLVFLGHCEEKNSAAQKDYFLKAIESLTATHKIYPYDLVNMYLLHMCYLSVDDKEKTLKVVTEILDKFSADYIVKELGSKAYGLLLSLKEALQKELKETLQKEVK